MLVEVSQEPVRVQDYDQGTTDLIHDYNGDDRSRHLTSGVNLCSSRHHGDVKP